MFGLVIRVYGMRTVGVKSYPSRPLGFHIIPIPDYHSQRPFKRPPKSNLVQCMVTKIDVCSSPQKLQVVFIVSVSCFCLVHFLRVLLQYLICLDYPMSERYLIAPLLGDAEHSCNIQYGGFLDDTQQVYVMKTCYRFLK